MRASLRGRERSVVRESMPTVGVATVLVAAVMFGASTLVSGCGGEVPSRDGPGGAVGAAVSIDQATPTSKAAVTGTLQLPKAELHETLDGLFAEHVALVLATTGAAAASDEALTAQHRRELDKNSDDIVGAMVGVYGPDGSLFGQGWREHTQAFVDYAVAGAAPDATKAVAARQRLDKYPGQVGAFLAQANPNLTRQAVADLVQTHIADITALIDQQVAAGGKAISSTSGTSARPGMPAAAPPGSDHAVEHMTALATALTDAIAKQFPTRFPS